MVEPVHPFQGGKLDCFDTAPGTTRADHLGFVEAFDGFGEGIVPRVRAMRGPRTGSAVADAAERRLDAGIGQALGVADREVLPEFKWSSQRLPEPIVATRQAPRRGFSKPGSCAVWR